MPEYIYEVSEAGSTFKKIAQLVRCKDCEYWKHTRFVGGEGMACVYICANEEIFTDPEDFCSYGVPRDDTTSDL